MSLDPEIPLYSNQSEITRIGLLWLLGLLWLFPLRHDVYAMLTMNSEEVEKQKWQRARGEIGQSDYILRVYGGRLINWVSIGMFAHL